MSAPSATPATERPVPHPLDYVWRFDDATIHMLLGRLTVTSAPGDTVAYLGTPMLHAAAVRGRDGRKHVLLDHDPRVVSAANATKAGSAICVDLLGGDLPNLDARMAVADPPWYADECSVFVNAAARLLAEGGRLLVAFGSRLMRPSAVADLDVVIAAAGEDGLTLESVSDRLCGYLSPPFEKASLARAGLAGIPHDWRRGQLLEFVSVDPERPPRRTMPVQDWLRIDIDEIPLRVRPTAPAVGTELMSSIVEGDQLISVSRRDGIRGQVALWTSRNRVFGSRDAGRLADVLRQMGHSDSDAFAGAEREVAERVGRLVTLERSEHGLASEQATR
ncbi:MAG: hypothetical protein ACYDHH_23575 [Solirubrobacteraceae bacterium]